jgi:hypothetical protein
LRLKAVTACAGVLTATVVCTGATAFASGINVSPSTARRGDSVTVTGGCQGGGVRPDTWASLTSDALVSTGDNINAGAFSLTTTVRDNAPFGRSTITVTCNNSKNQYRGSILIQRGKNGNPDRWPRTGGGGMANVADGHGTHNMGGIASVASLVLLAGAVAVGGFTVVRSRARAARGRH